MTDTPEKSSTNSGEGQQGKLFQYEEFHQGPLPPPDHIAKYEHSMPGAADRIFTMAEKEQKNRHKLISRDLNLTHTGRLLGLIFAFLIAILTIGGGIFLLYHDKSITGMMTLVGGIGTLVGSFLYREKKKKDK